MGRFSQWPMLAIGVSLVASAAAACPGRPGPNWEAQWRQVWTQTIPGMGPEHRARPILQGVAYDVPGQRVFISSCQRRPYACDLLRVDFNRPQDQEAVYFRGPSGAYGYVWPAVSADGRHLAAVRALRSERWTQREVTHELVRIDLQTGDEQVLASAGDGRFDRVVYAGDGTLLVVRLFRSSPSAPCRDDYCADWAEVLVVGDGETSILPIQAAGSPFDVQITPIGTSRTFLITAASRSFDLLSGGHFTRSHVSAWVFDTESGLSTESTRVPETLALLAEVEDRQGSLGGWAADTLVAGRVGRLEGQPFCGTLAEMATVNATTLADSSQGVYVTKHRERGRLRYRIGRIENRGGIPWTVVSEIAALHPSR